MNKVSKKEIHTEGTKTQGTQRKDIEQQLCEPRVSVSSVREFWRLFVWFVSLVVIILSTSCENLLTITIPTTAAKTKYSTVRITFDDDARTVFPAKYFDNFVYTFTMEDGEPQVLIPDEGVFYLLPGNWNVKADAYIGSDVAASGDENFTLDTEESKTITIILQAEETEGEGTFSFYITFPEGTNVETFTFTNLQENTDVNLNPILNATSIIGTVQVPAGMYQLILRLEKGRQYAGTTKAVHVYDLLPTEFGTAEQPINFETLDFTGSVTGYGKVQITLPATRTVMPQASFDNYKYTFTKEGDEPLVLTPENGYFYLLPGSWNVQVGAYIGAIAAENLAASGEADFTLNAEETKTVQVALEMETNGHGTFGFHITYPANTTVEEFTLTKWDAEEGNWEGEIDLSSFADLTEMIGIKTDVPAGFYLLILQLEYSGTTVGLMEIVHIYNLMITEFGTALSPIVYEVRHFTNPMTFTETVVTKTYGDAPFTNPFSQEAQGTGELTFTSSDEDIAIVGSNGEVTILSAGNVTITAVKEADDTYLRAEASYTLIVNKKNVTITGLSAENKIYDGETTATVAGTTVIDGNIDGANLFVVPGSAAFNNKNVENGKTVTFSSWSLDGSAADNYLLTEQPLPVTANITPKGITITGVSAQDRVYNGSATVTLTGGTLQNFIPGDDIGFTLGTGSMADTDAGENKAVTTNIQLTGDDAGNYTLTQPTGITVNISKAPGAILAAPTAAANGITQDSITVNEVTAPNGQAIQYGINTTNVVPSSWQNGRVFSGLESGTTYYVFVRAVENTNYLESVSAAAVITTEQSVPGDVEFFWVDEDVIQLAETGGEDALSVTQTLTIPDSLTITATVSGSNFRWLINGTEDISLQGESSYTFTSTDKVTGPHNVSLFVLVNSKWYSINFEITVTE